MSGEDFSAGFTFGMSRQAVADLARMALADLLRARTAWDEAPALNFMYFQDGAVRISPFSLVPDHAWAEAPPPYVLEHLANGLAGSPLQGLVVRVAPETFFGVVFRCETWVVKAKSAGEKEAATRAARRRELYRHPGRVESRTAWAMTRTGMLAAIQERGSAEVDVRPVKGLEGTVPDALMTMFRAVVTTGTSKAGTR